MACQLSGTMPLYLNKCWDIFNWTLRKKLQWNFNKKMHLKILSVKWRPFCPGGGELRCWLGTEAHARLKIYYNFFSNTLWKSCWKMFLCEITLHIYRKESLQSWTSWVSYGMSIQSTISYRKLTMLQLDCFVFHMDHYVYAPSQWEMMLHCNIISHWLGAYTKLSLISYHMFHFLPYLHSAHFL